MKIIEQTLAAGFMAMLLAGAAVADVVVNWVALDANNDQVGHGIYRARDQADAADRLREIERALERDHPGIVILTDVETID